MDAKRSPAVVAVIGAALASLSGCDKLLPGIFTDDIGCCVPLGQGSPKDSYWSKQSACSRSDWHWAPPYSDDPSDRDFYQQCSGKPKPRAANDDRQEPRNLAEALNTLRRATSDGSLSETNRPGVVGGLTDLVITANGGMVSGQAFQATNAKRNAEQNGVISAECQTECDKNGPFCLKVNLVDQNRTLEKVEKARTLLMKADDKGVKKKDFLSIFGLSNDPCRRTDTGLRNDLLTNSGNSCRVSSPISDTRSNIGFTIVIPTKLEGRRLIDADRLGFVFASAATSPTIELSDKDLNQSFAGTVRQVTATAGLGIASTANGCIAVVTKR